MSIGYKEWNGKIHRNDAIKHKNYIFIYADDVTKTSKCLGDEIRDLPNAFGIRYRDNNSIGSFWKDEDFEKHKQMIIEDFENVTKNLTNGKTLVIPHHKNGIFDVYFESRFRKKSPKTYNFIVEHANALKNTLLK